MKAISGSSDHQLQSDLAATEFSRTSRRLGDDSLSGWLATAAPRTRPVRTLEGSQEVDCAVVGAGFSGLAMARRLVQLRPQWRVVVLEAQEVGEGTAGRSSGFVVDLVDSVAALPDPFCGCYVKLSRAGIDQLRSLVSEHSIDCQWDEKGWLRAAAGPGGVKGLDGWRAWIDRWEMPHEYLDAAAMANLTGSDFYCQGIRFLGLPLVQGASLVRGLADVLPPSVELYERSPVRLNRRDGHFQLEAEQGSVTTPRVLLATNGYSSLLGLARRQVLPVHTFGSMTRPLSPAQQESLGGETEWGLLGADYMGSSLRRTRDQRLLVRNTLYHHRGLQVDQSRLEEIGRQHQALLEKRFPGLSPIEVEFTWSGVTGATRSRLPFFGEWEKNLFLSAGYSGAGIALGTVMGGLLAELAAGEDSPPLRELLSLPAPRKMPPEPFRSVGAKWTLAGMNARAQRFL